MWHSIWNSPVPPPCMKYNWYCCASRKCVFKVAVSSNFIGCGCFSGACALWPTAWQETDNTISLCISCSYILPSLFLCSVTLSDLNLYSFIFCKLAWCNVRVMDSLTIWGHSCCFGHCLHCLVYMLLRQLSNGVSAVWGILRITKKVAWLNMGTQTHTHSHTHLNLPTSFLLFFCHSLNLLSPFTLKCFVCNFKLWSLATFPPKVPGTSSSWT